MASMDGKSNLDVSDNDVDVCIEEIDPALVRRGRLVFVVMAAVVVVVATVSFLVGPSHWNLVRFCLVMAVVIFAWHGKDGAVTLLAIWCTFSAIIGLTAGLATKSMLQVASAVACVAVLVVLVKSDSLSKFLLHQRQTETESEPESEEEDGEV